VSSVEEKKKRLDRALIVSGLAALLVAGALYAASIVKQEETPQLTVSVVEAKQTLSVSASVSADTIVRFVFTPLMDDAGTSGKPVEQSYQTGSSGRVRFTVPVAASTKKYRVVAEWSETDGLVRTMTRVVSVAGG
jgi:hypothetical protein